MIELNIQIHKNKSAIRKRLDNGINFLRYEVIFKSQSIKINNYRKTTFKSDLNHFKPLTYIEDATMIPGEKIIKVLLEKLYFFLNFIFFAF